MGNANQPQGSTSKLQDSAVEHREDAAILDDASAHDFNLSDDRAPVVVWSSDEGAESDEITEPDQISDNNDFDFTCNNDFGGYSNNNAFDNNCFGGQVLGQVLGLPTNSLCFN